MKSLYKEKRSKKDIALLSAYESGLADGAGVEHEFKEESEVFFIEIWAKAHKVSLPKEYEAFSGKWNLDVGHIETPKTDFT